jgi:trehalose-phosphatase
MTLERKVCDALIAAAGTARLLVCSDYDGVLSPIVSDPAAARPVPASVRALRTLAGLPATEAAAISGRGLRDLAALSGLGPPVHLVGSHGVEFDDGFAAGLPPHVRELHERVRATLAELTGPVPGAGMEVKPVSITVHVRNADPAAARRLLAAVHSGPATWPGVHVQEGKMVVELTVLPTDKGTALAALRSRFDSTTTVYLGDDLTDEKAFAVLSGPDVGIKVGDGPTAAAHRVATTDDVTAALTLLADRRRA